ncbi:UNVERIFIED_CONTAM: hypothetical protein Sindi_3020600, partial [Sesamum indicum]
REMNEVCGVSGDIRIAMEEFNAAIQEAGLIPLPMQGEWYTWHNCSTSSRSLWKRLDRILINDRWLARFPSSCYHSLLPRTSDHSPLVIHGDMQHHQQTGGAKGFLDEAQQLVSNDRQNEALLQLEHCCRLVYAKALKLEQIMLQQRAKIQWMKEGDQCTRIFFRKIAQRRVARRILQINDDYGTSHTEPGEIINEFVHYYQNHLGGNRRQILIDIGFLRLWARHILSNEEASHLISIFTPADVKQAVFDIAEDKAPGPDGYSSGFFKAAWPVVGQEVTKAVLDFFSIGKLLKQVNSTILALLPKVHTPMTVGDYRPISCCNVLYKIIAKLLVQRLSVVLDKIISPCQGAFIPGRIVHRLQSDEATTSVCLKVDIRKAYDTVEWDFLLAVLQLFGFPQTFTKWIEECVTTASFSIGLNGNPHGFFAGARGLRQGDPLSPYLFVLVMEVLHLGFLQLIEQDMQFTYHWKCESAKVFQLGFADDLLLFCRADLDSLRVLKMGLDRFAEWSGLRLNVQKSHVIISRSAQGWKDQILAAMGFQEGHLAMRYLGIPLLSSRLSIADCQPLLLKIDAHIKGWEGISLSYAGRVQIIKSVLSAMSIYWASAFILPKAIIKKIDKRLRNFLWKGTYTSGYAKVAWKDVCKPIVEGGQGIKDIGILNRALMAKKLCDVIRCDRTSIWVEWLKHGRLRDNSIWAINEKGGSWGWRKLLRLRSSILPMTEFLIGEGRTFFLWKDSWHHLGPLIARFPRGPSLLGLDESAKLVLIKPCTSGKNSLTKNSLPTTLSSLSHTRTHSKTHTRMDGGGNGGAASPAGAGGTADDGEPTGGGLTSGDRLEAGKIQNRRECEELGFVKSPANSANLETEVEQTSMGGRTTLQTLKGGILAGKSTINQAPPDLGFSAMEDETSGSLETIDTDTFLVNRSGLDTMTMRGRISNDQDEKSATDNMSFNAPQKLGFSEASAPSINGGRTATPSPRDFNITEFLNLANRIVDVGDTDSIEALAKLKARWEAKFGHGENLRQQTGTGNTLTFGRLPLRACLGTMVERALAHGIAPPVPYKKSETVLGKKTTCLVATPVVQQTPATLAAAQIQAMATDRRRTAGTAATAFSAKKQQHHEGGDDMCDDVSDDMCDDATDDVEADAGADLNDDVGDDTGADAAADVVHDISNTMEKISPLPTQVRSFPTGLFVGNIPLNANLNVNVDDKIADAFNNSSRRTLSYIPPTIQNGEVVVRPTMETIRNGSTKWKTTAIGYLLGKRPYFYHVKDFAFSVWPGLQEVKATSNGFFFFQFKTVAYMEEAIEGGPWLFQGQPIVLQKWEPGMAMRKLKHTQVPVWIKMRHLPVELWTEEGLSTVASGIGKPLYPDAITRACTRLDFARVCVMLDVSSNLPKHIIIMTPDEEGGETPCKIDVEYEWLPSKSVYVPKKGTAEPTMVHDQEITPPPRGVEKQRDGRESPRRGGMRTNRAENGKEIVVYNTFDALHLIDDADDIARAIWNVRGLNKRDHQLAVQDIVAEFRLQLLGLLETRVRINNIGGVMGSLETIAMQTGDIPWLIGGDFNAVRDISEICGASGDVRMAMEEFNDCIQNAGLLPLPMQGEWYTWHNCSASPRNLWKRLDRMMINDRWMARFPTSFYTSLTPRTSDHSPLVLYGDSQQQYGGMFRFDNYLTLSPEFIPSVQQIWQHNIIGAPMYAVTRKLKALKPVFREQDELLLQLEHCCRFILAKAAKLEQSMLQQRAKMQWMKGGDQCSRYSFVRSLNGGRHEESYKLMMIMEPLTQNHKSEEDVNSLLLPFTPADVKQAVFDIAEDKAPGPDGYSSGFFKAAWPIVGRK